MKVRRGGIGERGPGGNFGWRRGDGGETCQAEKAQRGGGRGSVRQSLMDINTSRTGATNRTAGSSFLTTRLVRALTRCRTKNGPSLRLVPNIHLLSAVVQPTPLDTTLTTMAAGKTKTTKPSASSQTAGGWLRKWLVRAVVAAVLYVTCQYLESIKVCSTLNHCRLYAKRLRRTDGMSLTPRASTSSHRQQSPPHPPQMTPHSWPSTSTKTSRRPTPPAPSR